MLVGSIIAIVLVIGGLVSCYRKVGPNEVLIITGGLLKGPYLTIVPETNTRVKVVKGGGTWVWPVIQQAVVENLDTFTIDVEVDKVMTRDAVKVNAKANVVLRVGGDKKSIAVASEKILGLNEKERDNQMYLVTKGAVRDTLSQMTPQEAYDREQFSNSVKTACEPIFKNMGLEITSISITDIWDDDGYYDSLSAADIAKKKADAEKAKAESAKDARIAKAKADRDAKIEEAKNDQEAKIAQLKANDEVNAQQKERDVNKANYDAEVYASQAKAEKASDIENAKQNAILQKQQIEINRNQYQADIVAKQEAESSALRNKSDAEYYQAQKQADANAYKTKTDGEAQSEQIIKIGQAKAESQRALAQALNEKGGQSSLQAKIIDILPVIAKNNAEAVSHIEHLTVLNGAKGLQETSAESLNSAMMLIKNTTGIDLKDLVEKRANGQITLNEDDANKLVEKTNQPSNKDTNK